MSRAFTIFLLLACGVPGCLGFGPAKEKEGPWDGYSPRFGLGLDTSVMPAPGKFQENATDLERLAGWLNVTGRQRLVDHCGVKNLGGFDSLMRDQYYLSVVDAVVSQCVPHSDKRYDEAGEDHARGVADEKIRALVASAPGHLDASVRAVDAIAWPANAVDLEVLGRVMRWVIWMNASYTSSLPMAEEYLVKPSKDLAGNAYMNFYIPLDGRISIEWFMANYPWASEPCDADEAEVRHLHATAWTRLNETLAKAERLRPPDEIPDLSSNYGRLVKDYRPAMQFSDRHGWWPATLWYLYLVEGSDSYWDHRYDPVLPTNEEAMFLLASYLNESRTLITDADIAILQGNVPHWDFEEYPFWPSLVVASSPEESPWTYGDLPCRGTATETEPVTVK